MVQTYEGPSRLESFHAEPAAGVNATIVTPTDRIRWGPVIAGLFAALSVLIVLSVLGLAIGLSTVDADDRPSNYGIGAGIWGAITALVAFFFGGWMAARTSAVRGEHNGMLQGAMVWMVAIPLLIYMLAGGIGSLFSAAGSVASTGAQSAATVAQDPDVRQDMEANTEQATQDMRQAASDFRDSVTPERVETVANRASGAAWGTLISLLLGLGAATLGGFIGSRNRGGDVTTT